MHELIFVNIYFRIKTLSLILNHSNAIYDKNNFFSLGIDYFELMLELLSFRNYSLFLLIIFLAVASYFTAQKLHVFGSMHIDTLGYQSANFSILPYSFKNCQPDTYFKEKRIVAVYLPLSRYYVNEGCI